MRAQLRRHMRQRLDMRDGGRSRHLPHLSGTGKLARARLAAAPQRRRRGSWRPRSRLWLLSARTGEHPCALRRLPCGACCGLPGPRSPRSAVRRLRAWCAGHLRACTATHPPTLTHTSFRSGCRFGGRWRKEPFCCGRRPPIPPPPCIAYPAPACPSLPPLTRLYQGKPWVAAASSPRRGVIAAAAARTADRGSNRRHRWLAPRTGQPTLCRPAAASSPPAPRL